jgi:hypothetical protein
MKQKLKNWFYKTVYHLFPIRMNSFQDFFTAARMNNFICTVEERIIPCFNNEPICTFFNEQDSCFYSIEVRGKKEDEFDIVYSTPPQYYSPRIDSSAVLKSITELKDDYKNTLRNHELLKPELCHAA